MGKREEENEKNGQKCWWVKVGWLVGWSVGQPTHLLLASNIQHFVASKTGNTILLPHVRT